jgi:hypothetical protein
VHRLVLYLAVVLSALAAAVPGLAAHNPHVVVTGVGTLAGGASADVGAYDHNGRIGGKLRVETAPGFVFVSRVTCVRAVGDVVLVGGVIFRSPSAATLGHTSLVAIRDGGPAGPDLLGLAFSSSGLDSCPVFPIPLHPLTSGGFTVERSG